MNDATSQRKTLSFHVLRVCERLHLSEHEFLGLRYEAQLRLLAFDLLREEEASSGTTL